MLGNMLVVAGDDFDRYIQAGERLQRRPRAFLRRVEKGDEAREDQIGFVVEMAKALT